MLLISCVALGKQPDLSEPLFPCLSDEGGGRTHLLRMQEAAGVRAWLTLSMRIWLLVLAMSTDRICSYHMFLSEEAKNLFQIKTSRTQIPALPFTGVLGKSLCLSVPQLPPLCRIALTSLVRREDLLLTRIPSAQAQRFLSSVHSSVAGKTGLWDWAAWCEGQVCHLLRDHRQVI